MENRDGGVGSNIMDRSADLEIHRGLLTAAGIACGLAVVIKILNIEEHDCYGRRRD